MGPMKDNFPFYIATLTFLVCVEIAFYTIVIVSYRSAVVRNIYFYITCIHPMQKSLKLAKIHLRDKTKQIMV